MNTFWSVNVYATRNWVIIGLHKSLLPTVPSPYLKQYWLVTTEISYKNIEYKFCETLATFIQVNALKVITYKAAILHKGDMSLLCQATEQRNKYIIQEGNK